MPCGCVSKKLSAGVGGDIYVDPNAAEGTEPNPFPIPQIDVTVKRGNMLGEALLILAALLVIIYATKNRKGK